MSRRGRPWAVDDPEHWGERPGPSREPVPDLFGPWPERPVARVEQEALALPGATIRGQYVVWRATADGALVYGAFCAGALVDLAEGRRLSAKGLAERLRVVFKREINNSFTALLSRDAESDHPRLRGQFTKRQRTAA